jgi:hypothetical protein
MPQHDPYQTCKAQQSRALDLGTNRALALGKNVECKHYLVTTEPKQQGTRLGE